MILAQLVASCCFLDSNVRWCSGFRAERAQLNVSIVFSTACNISEDCEALLCKCLWATNSSWVTPQLSLSCEVENVLEFDAVFSRERNKLTLSLLWFLLFPVFFGADRCYMGQIALGCCKGLTFGGLGMWFLVDYWVLLYNFLAASHNIDTFGFRGSFADGQLGVHAAFQLGIAGLVLHFFLPAMAAKRQGDTQELKEPLLG